MTRVACLCQHMPLRLRTAPADDVCSGKLRDLFRRRMVQRIKSEQDARRVARIASARGLDSAMEVDLDEELCADVLRQEAQSFAAPLDEEVCGFSQTIYQIVREERAQTIARLEAECEAALGPMDTDDLLRIEEEIKLEQRRAV